MSHPRRIALEVILELAEPGMRVLDLGAGESPLARLLTERDCSVLAVDQDYQKVEAARGKAGYRIGHIDMADPWSWSALEDLDDPFDLVVSMYAVQHVIGREALVWPFVADALKLGGRFIYCGRYRPDAPIFEMERDDPLMGHNHITLKTLAFASGLKPEWMRVDWYAGEKTAKIAEVDFHMEPNPPLFEANNLIGIFRK